MAKGNMEDSGKPTHPRSLMKCFPFSHVPSLNHGEFCIAKIIKDYCEDPTFDIWICLDLYLDIHKANVWKSRIQDENLMPKSNY